MLTITHFDNGDTSVRTDDNNYVLADHFYAMGWTKPHYPVPAIPVAAHIWPDCVVLTQYGVRNVRGYYSTIYR